VQPFQYSGHDWQRLPHPRSHSLILTHRLIATETLFGEVEGVVAEAIDVLGQIRADCGDGIVGNGLAALFDV
jgi:hypothetical protein